ncbi:MAG: hypothetical protein GY816_12685 [Cytophagales bacterium]|nr:hypothetical protein [Cytophagales bacterium]
MKKLLVFVYLALLIGFLSWLGYKGVSKLQAKEEISDSQNTLISIFEKLGVQEEEADMEIILVYFNSEYEHCQFEIKEIQNNLDRVYHFSHPKYDMKQNLTTEYTEITEKKCESTLLALFFCGEKSKA